VRVRSECKRGGCPRRQCTTFTLFIYTRACTPIPRSEGCCSRGEGCVPLVRIRNKRSATLACRGKQAGLFPGSILPSIVPRISMSAEEVAASLLNVSSIYLHPHPLYLSLSLLCLMLNCYVILHHRPLVTVVLYSIFSLPLSNFLHFLALFLSISLSLSLALCGVSFLWQDCWCFVFSFFLFITAKTRPARRRRVRYDYQLINHYYYFVYASKHLIIIRTCMCICVRAHARACIYVCASFPLLFDYSLLLCSPRRVYIYIYIYIYIYMYIYICIYMYI